jgi:hypothetical protein
MNSKNNIPDYPNYRLSLVDFLLESHPEQLSDERFINARAQTAAETYAQAVPEDDAKDWAIRLLPECESIFAKYPLSNDFADAFRETFPEISAIAFEKDLLTGKILSHCTPMTRCISPVLKK